MLVPISWLKEYIDFEDTIEGLSDKLTFSGLEVEEINRIGGGIEGVVIGEVRKVWPHPDADRLRMCTVFNGEEEIQLVCGAPNVREGLKTALAQVNTVLPDGLKIKKSKIRGQESYGMLCAEDELGLSGGHEGILEFPEEAVTGACISSILGEADTVFQLEVTPNRPDCLSIIGIARELAALYNTPLKKPQIELKENSEKVADITSVDNQAPEDCGRYTARILKDIKVGPSPDWMQKRLNLSGIRPINNVVDITNYVMLEYGQPLHAFDHALLAEGRIIVRNANDGEKFTTLDKSEHELEAQHLVICDAEKPVALAGIMGGANSEIQQSTSTVLLESAWFKPGLIRSTSRILDSHSESSYRFSRCTDIGNVELASQRAAQLLCDHANATLVSGVIDKAPLDSSKDELSLSLPRACSLIGIDISKDYVKQLFESIELHILSETDDSLRVSIPTFRPDLSREADLIEEVARLYGLDKIPSPAPRAEIVVGAHDKPIRAQRELRNKLVGLGLQEIMNYSFTSPKLLDLLDPSNLENRVVLSHPISADQSVMRSSLLPQLVETLGKNKSKQNDEAAVFELSKIFLQRGEKQVEKTKLAIGLMGNVGRSPLNKQKTAKADEMFSWLKGIVEAVLAPNQLTLKAADVPGLEKGQTATINIGDKVIGVIGMLPAKTRNTWRITDQVAVAELDVPPLLAHYQERVLLKTPTNFPASSRDVAILVDQSLSHQDVLNALSTAKVNELESTSLFDVFSNEQLGAGKKSMAYRFTFRAKDRTLTEDEINEHFSSLQDILKSSLNAQIRDS